MQGRTRFWYLALSVAVVLVLTHRMAGALDGNHQEFELGDFTFEDGSTLPGAQLVYVTYGALNASKSNAVLLPSWYGGDHHGYDFLIGPGKAFESSGLFHHCD